MKYMYIFKSNKWLSKFDKMLLKFLFGLEIWGNAQKGGDTNERK